MTPKPAKYELSRRPLYDPAPGEEHIAKCLKEKSLSLHHLSDRTLGSLRIAIDTNFLLAAQCNMNESDLAAGFVIRSYRSKINLGQGLRTPDGKGVVAIPIHWAGKTVWFELYGDGNENYGLPAVKYDKATFEKRYNTNWEQWRDSLIYREKADGELEYITFSEYPWITNDTAPPDWPVGLTRDRERASENYYRNNNWKPKSGTVVEPTSTANSTAITSPIDSTPGNGSEQTL